MGKIIHALYMRATVIIITIEVTIIKWQKNTIYIPKESCINTISIKKNCINIILNWDDRHCVEQIQMKLVVFYNLCDIFTSHDLLRSIQNVSIREKTIVFL